MNLQLHVPADGKERADLAAMCVYASTLPEPFARSQWPAHFTGSAVVISPDGARVCLLDDVISTGSTQAAMRNVVEKAGGAVTVEAAVFTEGDPQKWAHIVALGHLPVFTS